MDKSKELSEESKIWLNDAVSKAAQSASRLLRLNDDDIEHIKIQGRELYSVLYKQLGILSLPLNDGSIFDIEDWEKVYGFTGMSREIADTHIRLWQNILNEECQFHRKEGKKVRDTHTLFIGLEGVTIDGLQTVSFPSQQSCFICYPFGGIDGLYKKYGFIDRDIGLNFGCYLVLTNIVPGSTFKTPGEQLKLLPEGYIPPSFLVEAAKNVCAMGKTGIPPNPNCLANTSTTNDAGDRIRVGKCRKDGKMEVEVGWGVSPSPETPFSEGGSIGCDVGIGAQRDELPLPGPALPFVLP